jgi:hypothetical protein
MFRRWRCSLRNFCTRTAESNAIRKVSPDGVISTVPGAPAGEIAVDAAGNIYINRDGGILKITPAGAVSAIASIGDVGRGFYGYFIGLVNDRILPQFSCFGNSLAGLPRSGPGVGAAG